MHRFCCRRSFIIVIISIISIIIHYLFKSSFLMCTVHKSLHYHSSSSSPNTVIILETFSLSCDVFPYVTHLPQSVCPCFTHPVKSPYILIVTTVFECHLFFQNMFFCPTLFQFQFLWHKLIVLEIVAVMYVTSRHFADLVFY